ncbi:hypothetical protein E2C01_034558 [Portunus trituberculatus]|uniref:Uncharacterized protein n=1 Tax=Portunus trituberculatus TaxID=210409 RepID=A0A5B7F0W8_PORTR|nr:hypothetical protein [Portunus trituberculatus]
MRIEKIGENGERAILREEEVSSFSQERKTSFTSAAVCDCKGHVLVQRALHVSGVRPSAKKDLLLLLLPLLLLLLLLLVW